MEHSHLSSTVLYRLLILCFISVILGACAGGKLISSDSDSENANFSAHEVIKEASRAHLTIDGLSQHIEIVAPARVDGSDEAHLGVYWGEGGRSLLGLSYEELGNYASSMPASLVKRQDGKEAVLFKGHLDAQYPENGDSVLTGQLKMVGGSQLVTIDATINQSLGSLGNAKLQVEGHTIVLNGTLGTRAYVDFYATLAHDDVLKNLVLEQVPGSIEDYYTKQSGYLVREKGLTTTVTSSSEVSSGGVDLFLAGETREIHEGAKLGVHSWCCSEDGRYGGELPADHPEHLSRLNYFSTMLGPELGPEFYFFTINSVDFGDMYWLTDDDIVKYNLGTIVPDTSR